MEGQGPGCTGLSDRLGPLAPGGGAAEEEDGPSERAKIALLRHRFTPGAHPPRLHEPPPSTQKRAQWG